MEILQPPSWPRPKGYSNGIKASGDMVFVAGQVGWNAREEFESDKLEDQVRQALQNILAILKECDAGAEHIVRMTWFVTHKQEYLDKQKEIGAVYREVMGQNYPVMSLIHISGLIEEGGKVEIEATAVV
ncbi:MAG: enamine deaminase RidA [Alphaproteobacteria bacterium]|nr:MAG: enamine deaminase RidA [Alphaproteobacteria bacterium]